MVTYDWRHHLIFELVVLLGKGATVTSFDVGATLRAERVRRQISLEDVARQTKIPGRFLRAIESGDFEPLPGIIFTRNFIRQYADSLGIDSGPLLTAVPTYNLETAPLPAVRSRTESRWDPRLNSALASLSWTLLAGGAAVAAFVHFNRPPQPDGVRAAQISVKAGDRTASSQTKTSGQKVQVTPSGTPQGSQAAPSEAVVTDQSQAADASPAEDRAVRVLVTAHQDSWLQVTADGKTAFYGILKANESTSFDSDAPVKLRTGNAGGILITLNGRELEALGPEGQIRTVSLTAEGPQYVPKSPPVSSDPT
jgi:cytoskeletal protein RodZ